LILDAIKLYINILVALVRGPGTALYAQNKCRESLRFVENIKQHNMISLHTDAFVFVSSRWNTYLVLALEALLGLGLLVFGAVAPPGLPELAWGENGLA
jgi:hypothetical protein